MMWNQDTGRRLFDVVVHAAWADHALAAEEIAVTRAAARVFHPDGEAGARGKLALGPEQPLSVIAKGLTGRESALAFAVAAWVVLADGVERPRETAFLDRLRLFAGIPRDIAASMRRAVRRSRTIPLSRGADSQLHLLLKEVKKQLW